MHKRATKSAHFLRKPYMCAQNKTLFALFVLFALCIYIYICVCVCLCVCVCARVFSVAFAFAPCRSFVLYGLFSFLHFSWVLYSPNLLATFALFFHHVFFVGLVRPFITCTCGSKQVSRKEPSTCLIYSAVVSWLQIATKDIKVSLVTSHYR